MFGATAIDATLFNTFRNQLSATQTWVVMLVVCQVMLAVLTISAAISGQPAPRAPPVMLIISVYSISNNDNESQMQLLNLTPDQ